LLLKLLNNSTLMLQTLRHEFALTRYQTSNTETFVYTAHFFIKQKTSTLELKLTSSSELARFQINS